MVKPIRFTQAARKHKIGRAKVYEVITTGAAEAVTTKSTGTPGLAFTGMVTGTGGRYEVTVIIVEVADCFLVIHAQPTYQ